MPERNAPHHGPHARYEAEIIEMDVAPRKHTAAWITFVVRLQQISFGGSDKVMEQKTLIGSALMAVFSVVAYALYATALVQGETEWIYISAIVYFLPIIIEAAEDLQSTRIASKKLFILFAACFCIGVVYFGLLWYFVSLQSEAVVLDHYLWLTISLIVLPVFLLPQKVYPFIVTLMQLYNRSRGAGRQRP